MATDPTGLPPTDLRSPQRPADPALPTGSAPNRDELAEQCRQAWHYAEGYYPLERQWLAVADAVLRIFDGPKPAAEAAKTWVDPEVELIAECLGLFDGADADTVRRVCNYVLSRLAPPNFPQAF